jgi:hypothetical protein
MKVPFTQTSSFPDIWFDPMLEGMQQAGHVGVSAKL